jgi:hypothetical protein
MLNVYVIMPNVYVMVNEIISIDADKKTLLGATLILTYHH